MRHEYIGHDTKKSDRCEHFAKVEIRFCLRRIERVGDRHHEQSISICRRSRDGFGRYHAAVSGPVFDDDGLAELGLYPLADKAREDVCRGGWAKADDNFDW